VCEQAVASLSIQPPRRAGRAGPQARHGGACELPHPPSLGRSASTAWNARPPNHRANRPLPPGGTEGAAKAGSRRHCRGVGAGTLSHALARGPEARLHRRELEAPSTVLHPPVSPSVPSSVAACLPACLPVRLPARQSVPPSPTPLCPSTIRQPPSRRLAGRRGSGRAAHSMLTRRSRGRQLRRASQPGCAFSQRVRAPSNRRIPGPPAPKRGQTDGDG
jgi:hypothetical protein